MGLRSGLSSSISQSSAFTPNMSLWILPYCHAGIEKAHPTKRSIVHNVWSIKMSPHWHQVAKSNPWKQPHTTIPPSTKFHSCHSAVRQLTFSCQTHTHPKETEKDDLSLHRTHFHCSSPVATCFTLLYPTHGIAVSDVRLSHENSCHEDPIVFFFSDINANGSSVLFSSEPILNSLGPQAKIC